MRLRDIGLRRRLETPFRAWCVARATALAKAAARQRLPLRAT
jgi:hypothetical protein